MKAVVQRVSKASVVVDSVLRGEVPESTGGLVVLVGLEDTDGDADRAWMADKVVNLRIFEDEAGKMNKSVLEAGSAGSGGGTILWIPNFTVAGEARRGRRPSFDMAMKPERAEGEFQRLVEAAAALGAKVAQGVFRTHMIVTIVNDGPVTILLDSRGPR